MMKFLTLSLIILVSGVAYAGGESSAGDPPPQPSNRFTRILKDPVLTATIKAFEKKYHSQCDDPSTDRIAWRCLNGPQCGYTLTVECPAQGGSRIAPMVMEIEAIGFDDGTRNDLDSIVFHTRDLD